MIEVCCDSLERVRRAVAAGADRIELCSRLSVGGLTPSAALAADAVSAAGAVPVFALVRPREGDFVWSEAETQQMIASIRELKALGISGFVVGALRPDGSVDSAVCSRLLAEIRPLPATFHRAFDECADPFAALEEIIALGFDRLLTSGHAADAWQGRLLLRDLVQRAAGRIVVMPGCGVTPDNLPALAALTAASDFHGSRILPGLC